METKTAYNKMGMKLRAEIANGLRGENLRAYVQGLGINTADIMSPIHFSEFNPNKLVIEVRGKSTYHLV